MSFSSHFYHPQKKIKKEFSCLFIQNGQNCDDQHCWKEVLLNPIRSHDNQSMVYKHSDTFPEPPPVKKYGSFSHLEGAVCLIMQIGTKLGHEKLIKNDDLLPYS